MGTKLDEVLADLTSADKKFAIAVRESFDRLHDFSHSDPDFDALKEHIEETYAQLEALQGEFWLRHSKLSGKLLIERIGNAKVE
ncbi:hypothetical protein E4656_14080 [Natronospirillum operosum]|uniref:Uncharacterized protein n=1 Tax=Natronospirillum operosum TaxID=2759953 RepID=A0A4Z0W574_9GAMM|nr:hypothetical protein [Natronospirillum operosum]TGG92007.1 hypothetical protein E4656_14080 [Natronospirillum operosum]